MVSDYWNNCRLVFVTIFIATGLSLSVGGLLIRGAETSFTVEAFVSEPKLSELAMLKRSELVVLASHYKLEVSSGTRKGDVRKLLGDFLVDENLVSDEEIDEVETH